MKNVLESHDIRTTKARIDILELLKDSNPLTADEIYEKLIDKGAKLSSIYRNLSLFVDKSILTKIQGIDDFAYYQLNTLEHKHHVSCKYCKKTIPIDHCPIHDLETKIEKETNFIITNHIFEFVGICPDCQNKHRD